MRALRNNELLQTRRMHTNYVFSILFLELLSEQSIYLLTLKHFMLASAICFFQSLAQSMLVLSQLTLL